MSLLEVIALHVADAERAEAGGADRVELLGSMEHSGLSPEPSEVQRVRHKISIQMRPMVRLREGFETDGGEVARLRGLVSAYADAGADGVVLGYLNAHSMIDVPVVEEIMADATLPFTFHRAMDSTLDRAKAWRALVQLNGLDQVLTAGSVRGVEQGLDDLIRPAKADPRIARLTMAGGGLKAEHVPWLVGAGIKAFHIGSPARPGGSYKAYVDPELVASWRRLIDTTVAHERERRARQ